MTAIHTTALPKTAKTALPQPTRSTASAAALGAGIVALLLTLGLSAGLFAAPAAAQSYHLGLLGGVGGAIDGDPFDHAAIEAQIGYQRGIRDLVILRVGQLDLSADDDVFAVDGELTWLTLTSEYRLPEDFYLSGFFAGLGYYQRRNDFSFEDDEGVGVTFGIDGEIAITERWGVMIQLAGHWADLEGEQYWTTAMGGVTFSF